MTLKLNSTVSRIVVAGTRPKVPVVGSNEALRVTINGGAVPFFFGENGRGVADKTQVVTSLVFNREHHMLARLQSAAVPEMTVQRMVVETPLSDARSSASISRAVHERVDVFADATALRERRIKAQSATMDVLSVLINKSGSVAASTKGRRAAHAIKSLLETALAVDEADVAVAKTVADRALIQAPVWVGGQPHEVAEHDAMLVASRDARGVTKAPTALTSTSVSSELVISVPSNAFLKAASFVANTLSLGYRQEAVPLVAFALATLIRNRSGKGTAAVSTSSKLHVDKTQTAPIALGEALRKAMAAHNKQPAGVSASSVSAVTRSQHLPVTLATRDARSIVLNRSDIIRVLPRADVVNIDILGPDPQLEASGVLAAARSAANKFASVVSSTASRSLLSFGARSYAVPAAVAAPTVSAETLKSGTVATVSSSAVSSVKPMTTTVGAQLHARSVMQDYAYQDYAAELYTGEMRLL